MHHKIPIQLKIPCSLSHILTTNTQIRFLLLPHVDSSLILGQLCQVVLVLLLADYLPNITEVIDGFKCIFLNAPEMQIKFKKSCFLSHIWFTITYTLWLCMCMYHLHFGIEL